MVNPLRPYDQDSINHKPYYVQPSQWHPSTPPILINTDHPPLRDGTQEFANLVFGPKVTNDPLLSTRWTPTMQKEFDGYLGRCLFGCDDNFRARFPTEGVY